MKSQTRAERLFLDLFRAATLQGAVENAARRERAQLFQNCVTVPVDVYRLAESKGIKVEEDLEAHNCPEGLLIPWKRGYRIRLKASSTYARKRFSLAHELGHTLFYQECDDGPRHRIGILSDRERTAEEHICDLFAAALLMPASQVSQEFENVRGNSPAAVLGTFEDTARRFRVSLPALMSRIRTLPLSNSTYLVLYFKMRPNSVTGDDPALRVESCFGTGHWHKLRVWLNRSADGVGLRSVNDLYDHWRREQSGRFRGCFTFDVAGDLCFGGTTPREQKEEINASRLYRGKWMQERVEVLSASALYAWGTSENPGAYIITVLAPAHEDAQRAG